MSAKARTPMRVKRVRANSQYAGISGPSALDVKRFLTDVPDHATVTVRIPEWGWPKYDYTLTAVWESYE